VLVTGVRGLLGRHLAPLLAEAGAPVVGTTRGLPAPGEVEAAEMHRLDLGSEAAVLAALEDDYPMVRRSAVRALRGATGSRAAQALVDMVSHDPAAEVREEAVLVLADLLHRGANENT
jgi:nucleoside-diphosphate-sugar epimerase